MPVYLRTTARISADQVRRQLQLDEPATKAALSITGSLVIHPRWDIRVHVVARSEHLKVFATNPILVGLFYGGTSFGYADDEKRHFEQHYAAWLKSRFASAIAGQEEV
jgi:hypothetical protein